MTTATVSIIDRNNNLHAAVSRLASALAKATFKAESDALWTSLTQGAGWNGAMPMSAAKIPAALDAAESRLAGFLARLPATAKSMGVPALLTQIAATRAVVVAS